MGVRVGEGHALPADVAADRRRVQRHRGGRVGDVDRQVQVLEHPAEQRHRRGDADLHVEQRHQRAEQRALQRGERDERADRHAARGDRQPGTEVDQRGDGGEDDAHRAHPPAAGQRGAHLEGAFKQFHHGNVERPAAEVEDEHRLVLAGLVEAVSDGRRGRLV